MKIGWEHIQWHGRTHTCNVSGCRRRVNSGWVRVDQSDPRAEGFKVICTDCHFKIMAGLDPDESAPVPEWEEENRMRRIRDGS
jgi:hypothetical protein